MGRAEPITAAGRRRVEAALEERGLLLVQGQAEVPSVADLLVDRPVTTRGYSWDYVPAWNLTEEYESGTEVAVVKLLRGRRTLVHRRLWPAVDALAAGARARVLAPGARDLERRFVERVEAAPAIPARHLREQLRLEAKPFDRAKRTLEQWLCVLARERDDVEYHTHESALFPWGDGVIARACRRRKPLEEPVAVQQLLDAVGVAGPAARYLPALKA